MAENKDLNWVLAQHKKIAPEQIDLLDARKILSLAASEDNLETSFHAMHLLMPIHMGYIELKDRVEQILAEKVNSKDSKLHWLAISISLRIKFTKPEIFQIPNDNLAEKILILIIRLKSGDGAANKELATTLVENNKYLKKWLMPNSAFHESLDVVSELVLAPTILTVGTILYKSKFYKLSKEILTVLASAPCGLSAHETEEAKLMLKRFK